VLTVISHIFTRSMSKKVLYFDTETTGIDPQKNAIIQLSGMIEIDGEIVETFNYKIRPLQSDEINPEALAVHGITEAEMDTYPEPKVVLNQFLTLLEKYCNKFDRNDKYFPAGYNVKFDLEMLYAFARKQGEKYLGSFLAWVPIDAMPLVHYLVTQSDFKLPDYKLKTVCDHFKIPIQAHDAMSDITATRLLIKQLEGIISCKYEMPK
jgi:DNA polymerase-3 subunit epsilon